MNTTADIIARARQAAGLTLRDLAFEVDAHPNQISGWESGTHEPAAKRLLDILMACRCNLLRHDGAWEIEYLGDSHE